MVQVVTPGKIKKISILSPRTSKQTKLMQLYEGIYYQKFPDQEAALLDIYGTREVGSRFSKLKNDLENRLLNILLVMDLSAGKKNQRSQAYLKYFKTWAAANILVKLGITNYGIYLLEKVLRHFQKYEFTYLCLETTKVLRNHYFRHLGDLKKGNTYEQLTQKYLEQYIAETRLGGYLEYIVAHYVKQKSNKAQLNQTIERYLEEADQILPAELNGTIIYRKKMLEVSKFLNINDYRSAAQVCEQAVRHFETKQQYYRTYLVIFLNHWIACATQLRKYQLGTDLVQKALLQLKAGEYNWFKLMQHRIQLAFYKKDYELAYQTYRQVFQQPQLKKLPIQIQEEWKVLEAFAQFVRLAGHADRLENSRRKKFRVHRFLNNLEVFSRDKKGMNIPILIIHTSYLFLYRYYDQIIDRREALEKYRQRYLNNNKHQRSNVFLKMLLQMEKHCFRVNNTREAVRGHLQWLRQHPLEVTPGDYEVEIIPYEDLWELLIRNIQERRWDRPPAN